MNMTESPFFRLTSLMAGCALLLLLAGCGAEAPSYDPGTVHVSSTPEGAAIILDGEDTKQVTPHSFVDMIPGSYEFQVTLPGMVSIPEASLVDIAPAGVDTIDFTLLEAARAKKTVILEGFANVSCGPCPELTDNLLAMTAKPEFSPDKVQFIEFAVSWPQLADPFFLANPTGNSERYELYTVGEAPDLYVDGVRMENALDAPAMESAVRAALEIDPGFVIDVTADFTLAPVPATVTLTALRDLDLSGYGIYVAIYEKEVVIEPAPGVNGQTEFHHVYRENDTTLPLLGQLTVGNPQQFNATLGSNAAGPDSYVVVAFVQHQSTRAILQCGSTEMTTKERNLR